MPLNQRQVAVDSAIKRLQDNRFDFLVTDTGVNRNSPAIEDVTSAISDRFGRLGLYDVLNNLCRVARGIEVYDFDQYLFSRRYGFVERSPSIPFGFLFNLAVRAPDRLCTSNDPSKDWRESVEMARDIVASIDVEPYTQYWMVNNSPQQMNGLLEELGLYDHFFGLRQWSIYVTPLLLRSFFGTSHDEKFKAQVGWSVSDAVRLCEALIRTIRTDPARLRRVDLLSTGLSTATLDLLLRSFVHPIDQVNRTYVSPLAAKSADLMFRPLIAGVGDTFIAPAASTVGPAFYEVIAAAARATLTPAEVAELVGAGTERAISALLRQCGLKPTFEGAKYNEGKAADAGECDLVLEDENNILLIECKGKPLTRATMAGEQMAALLDYSGGIIASQYQALQHERILNDKGEILFDDGRRLKRNGRRVTRLSVTLLDHGSLQDRFLFINLVEPLIRSKIAAHPKHPNYKRYRQLNGDLDRLRSEMEAAERRTGNMWEELLGAASLSFGQLATLLIGVNNLAALVERIRKPASFGTMNPLLEHHYLRKQGILDVRDNT